MMAGCIRSRCVSRRTRHRPLRCGSTESEKGTVTPTNDYTVPPPGVTSIVELFETTNNHVGGIRQVDRVSMSTQDIPAFP